MIPVAILEKMPPTQRCRKILKIYLDAELRIAQADANSDPISPEESIYLGELGSSLLRDEKFSDFQREALRKGVGDLLSRRDFARTLNTLGHILRARLGKWAADWDFIDHQGRLNPRERRVIPGMRAYLEDIRSPYNVGSMFRTAESFGIEAIALSPLSANPLHPRASRTAMGCVEIIPWEYIALDTLEDPVFALETGGVPLDQFQFPPRGTLIAGSEELGVSPEALERADRSLGRVSVPTWGAKASLNVSVAFGIALNTWASSI